MENIRDLKVSPFRIFDEQWALVTAGTMEDHNTMTNSWGSLGTLWGGPGKAKPIVTLYIKNTRYTYEYMNKYEDFTVSFFPEECKPALRVFGSKSGRNVDKEAEAGFTAVPAGAGVGFAEAEMTLVCKRIYAQDLAQDKIPEGFAEADPYCMFIGEVVDIIEK